VTVDALRAYNPGVGPYGLTAFSGRGESPHRRYLQATAGARERLTQNICMRQGQQIWCNARADGHSPDKRDRVVSAPTRLRVSVVFACALILVLLLLRIP
jgi:hypothetical protein